MEGWRDGVKGLLQCWQREKWSGGVVPSTVSTRTGLSINQNFITEFYLYFTIRLP